jgi:hypothetical protein
MLTIGATEQVGMARRQRVTGGEEFEAIHVSRVPKIVRETVADLAHQRKAAGGQAHVRDVYAEAIGELLAAMEAGEAIAWLASRREGSRLMVWLPVSLAVRFKETAQSLGVEHTVVFLAAMRRYFAQQERAADF